MKLLTPQKIKRLSKTPFTEDKGEPLFGTKEFTDELFEKYASLGLTKLMPKHQLESMAIILEELLEGKVREVNPRPQTMITNIKLMGDITVSKKAKRTNRASKYRFDLMEVGDVIELNIADFVRCKMSLFVFIQDKEPTWRFIYDDNVDGYVSKITRIK